MSLQYFLNQLKTCLIKLQLEQPSKNKNDSFISFEFEIASDWGNKNASYGFIEYLII